MKALFYREHGNTDKLIYGDLPEPDCPDEHVLVAVKWVTLNWLDVEVLRGIPALKTPLPMIVGADCAGVVLACGSNVSEVQPGEQVVIDPFRPDHGKRTGLMLGESRTGCLTEKIAVHKTQVIPVPAELDLADLACLPTAYGTAYRMVNSRGKIRAGEKVLIIGAAGGVGSACVQLCKAIGAYVIGTVSSAEKSDFVQTLGADEVINSSTTEFSGATRTKHGSLMRGGGVDVCINYVGGDTWTNSLRTLKHQGRLLTCGAAGGYDAKTDLRYVFAGELEILGSDGWERRDLLELIDLLRTGKLKPARHPDIFRLREAKEAVELLERRRALGKVVVEVQS